MKTLIYKQPPNHPNVVPIMGISLDGGQCVMSALASGGALDDHLEPAYFAAMAHAVLEDA